METRLKILLSAYACEPGKGSEPEVGWQWALQAARFHDVTVLTRANNRASIEAGLERVATELRPRFVYHDLPGPFLALKRRLGCHALYLRLWHRSARAVVRRLIAASRFDLLHHLTWTGFRYPVAVSGRGVPWVWGPVGGIEKTPASLLPWSQPVATCGELLRNASNAVQSRASALSPRMRDAALVLAATRETEQAFAPLGVPVRLLPMAGIHVRDFPVREARRAVGLRLVFAGRLVLWKGIDLALCALAASQTEATLTFIGTGRGLGAARAMAMRLGLPSRVEFRGALTRAATVAALAEFDAFLFPSLHDSGGFAVLEAMASGLPAICLDAGGPALAVDETCGVKVPVASRAEIVTRLAAAIRGYALDPELRIRHGIGARARMESEFDWARKGEVLNDVYRELAADLPTPKPGAPA